jgi:hypothetical protein
MSIYESKSYTLMAEYKKSTYQTEKWTNKMSNGKVVTFLITTYFRWGKFTITISDEEKEKLLKKDSIIINDYNCSCDELWDGCYRYEELENKEKYNSKELKEINKLLYYNEEDDDIEKNVKEIEYDEDDPVEEDLLEANGWTMDDTEYGICCPCVLENQNIET